MNQTPSTELYRQIPLTQNQVSWVDAQDYEDLMRFKWHAVWSKNTGSFYASRSARKHEREQFSKNVQMHRYILNLRKGDGLEGDHINHDTLDNRRQNLRRATRLENSRNRKNPAQHGYSMHCRGCRCDICVSAAKHYREKYKNRPLSEKHLTHGTISAYINGCRCSPCTMARRDYARNQRGWKPREGDCYCRTCQCRMKK